MAQIGLKQLDSILTGSLQVSGSAGVTGSFSIAAGEKLFTGANENEYVQTDTADRMRFVVGGNQMLLLDEDDSRVNVGYGMKLGVGLGNNTTPGEMLEVVGNISASGTVFADNFESAGDDDTIDFNDSVDISGTLTMGDHLYIPDSIVHAGDTNTKIRFPEVDTISFHTSGEERLRITSTGQISG